MNSPNADSSDSSPQAVNSAAQGGAPAQTPAAPVTVLVVDDEPSIRDLLCQVLQQQGFAVLAAANGQAALEVYRQHPESVTVVLLDIEMPVLDGPRTLTALRQLAPGLPCCFMSAGSARYNENELLELGAACVFRKPFNNLGEVALVLGHLASVSSKPLPRQENASLAAPVAADVPERRRDPRFAGAPVAVLVTTPGAEPVRAMALNRSVGGLGVLANSNEDAGKVLNIRPAILAAAAAWVQVEVRHSRPRNHHWLLGCKIVGAFPATV